MKARLGVSLRAVSVRRGATWALRDIDLDLKPGGRWALIGPNGAGKTQLLKLLAADVWPTPTGRERRSYRLGGRELDIPDAKPRLAYLGGESQDKYARYGWNLCVYDLIATGLHRTDLLLTAVSPDERRRIAATLRACGLTRFAARRLSSLSYGQKRLALLARALAAAPDWLLLDEFYNGLDQEFRRRIDRILDAARDAGQAWIATAHRELDVPRGTRGIIELNKGRLVRVGTLKRGELAHATAVKGRTPRVRAARRGRRGVAPLVMRLERVDLYVEYRAVLKELDWELRRGEHWAIYGGNGAGKTSLLKMLYGDLAPALGGRVVRSGFPAGTPIEEWKRQVGYVSPELQTDYAKDVRVLELVASGRHASIGLAAPLSAADRAAAVRWLRFFRLLSFAARRPHELSYGQMRRALIARALAGQPRILLLDEPLTGLDPRQRVLVKDLLERLMRRRLTVVIAVHHAEDLPRGITRALRLEKRRACVTDPYSAN